MEAEAYLNGMLPRSDAALELGSSWLKGRETKENYFRQLGQETLRLIELQHELELDYAVDCQLFWNDFLRPAADALGLYKESSNADENPVTRQVYTNTFYRRPFIARSIIANSPIVDERFLKLIKEGKRKAILPSPFALVYLSDGIHRNEDGSIKNDIFAGLLIDAAKALNTEAKRLEKSSSVSFVQFNEPCICYAEEAPGFWSAIHESFGHASHGLKSVTSIHLYNGDASKFLPKLNDLPIDRIGIDAYATNLRKFSGFGKFLEAGIVNSKNSLVEEPEALAAYAKQIAEIVKPEGIAIVPNRPLELVPQSIAIKKIESIAKAAKLLRSG